MFGTVGPMRHIGVAEQIEVVLVVQFQQSLFLAVGDLCE